MTADDPSSEPSSTPPTNREAEEADRSESRQFLDTVLRETLQITDTDELLTSDDLRSLLALARRRNGEPLDVETMTELVQTVLRSRFRRLVESSTLWDNMTRQITDAMIDDPRTNERMKRFWKRLCEAAQ